MNKPSLAGESNTKRGKKTGKDKKKILNDSSFSLKIFKSCEFATFFQASNRSPQIRLIYKPYIRLI